MRIREALVGLGLLLVATIAGRAQDVEVYILMNLDDQTLESAALKIGAAGQVVVKVDPDLKGRKITLMLDDPLEEALERVAKAAKAHLWKIDARSYRIRSTPQKEGETAGDAPPVPEWKQKILARLEEAEMDLEFQGTPLREALDAVARAAAVTIRIDPEVLRTKSKDDLEVNTFSIPPRTLAKFTLDAVVGSVKLYYDLRWYGVFVSTAERLEALATRCVPNVEAAIPD